MKNLIQVVLVGLLAGQASAAQTNLAAGRVCKLSPAPNYRHCTDRGDPQQLTDGETTSNYFWTQKGTVGWTRAPYVTITVDLEKPRFIGGVSLTTAAGKAGVTWPMAIQVLVSEDNLTWYEAGDLVALDHAERGPWPDDYAIRRLHTDKLRARGRYVQFVLIPMPGGPFTFTDEIEVFGGEGEAVIGKQTSARQCFEEGRITRALRHRWDEDHRAFGEWLGREEAFEDLQAARLALHEKGPGKVKADKSFRAVLPITSNHAELFALQASAWSQRNLPPLSAWTANPWDPLELFLSPPRAKSSPVLLDAMRGETRSGAVNLANATQKPMDVQCLLQGLPDSVSLHEVEWSDTSRLIPVAAALRQIPVNGQGATVRVLPGLPRQLWISATTGDMPAGLHASSLELRTPDGAPLVIPVELRVRALDMPRQKTMWLGGWSYTDGEGRYGITDANRRALLNLLREYGVNAPWATSAVLRSFQFDPDNPGSIKLDTARFDEWIDQWPDARHYLVFLSVAHYSGAIKTSFGGAALGSDEFDHKVGLWITAWVRHLESKGIASDRLGLLIHDEPHEGSDIEPFLAWARAIRAAQPKVKIWEDPTYRNPAEAPAELFELCDFLSPNRPMWLTQGEPFAAFYRGQQKQGKTLQFYSCSGPTKLLDPYSYYRLQAWHAWDIGATGSFFWAFGDNGGASSWNEYLARGGPYTPLFIDAETVTTGKQMEAIRESTQDYETLVMLRNVIADAKRAGRDGPALVEAGHLLESVGRRVLQADGAASPMWSNTKDRGLADKLRSEVLDALERLCPIDQGGEP